MSCFSLHHLKKIIIYISFINYILLLISRRTEKHDATCDRIRWVEGHLPEQVPEGYVAVMQGRAKAARRLNMRFVNGQWRAEPPADGGRFEGSLCVQRSIFRATPLDRGEV